MSENNSRIQRSVQDLLQGDTVLSSADVQVAVDDYAITLTGTVDSYAQHQRAMALVSQYSRYRKIVDKIQTK
ncbi:MAG TPA: BON domain-containing protein [Candidatus Angelobacter sp.]